MSFVPQRTSHSSAQQRTSLAEVAVRPARPRQPHPSPTQPTPLSPSQPFSLSLALSLSLSLARSLIRPLSLLTSSLASPLTPLHPVAPAVELTDAHCGGCVLVLRGSEGAASALPFARREWRTIRRCRERHSLAEQLRERLDCVAVHCVGGPHGLAAHSEALRRLLSLLRTQPVPQASTSSHRTLAADRMLTLWRAPPCTQVLLPSTSSDSHLAHVTLIIGDDATGHPTPPRAQARAIARARARARARSGAHAPPPRGPWMASHDFPRP